MRKPLGTYSLAEGTLTDGKSPYTTWCTHWFDAHPSFSNGGMVAISWYEQGTRFLQVAPDGKITWPNLDQIDVNPKDIDPYSIVEGLMKEGKKTKV